MEPAFFNYINFIHGASQSLIRDGEGEGGGISGLFCGLNQVSDVTIWTAPAERNDRTHINAINKCSKNPQNVAAQS